MRSHDDGANPRARQPAKPSLVGKFFHTRKPDGGVGWQGRVIEEPAPGVYLCGLFEWLMGEEDTRVLVRLEDMLAVFDGEGGVFTRFEFYSSADEMSDKWNRVLQHNQRWAVEQAEKKAEVRR